ncbi:coilin-like [Hibiscus syriacus]|uniref:coilin-like n=1 Tax=Hibiscus syriacus TaxID=106335 RepID=UPI001924C7B1|nr:coilin-like [Hibiscus syriacus]
MDFDKLTPYSGLPKEGDLVAYRLVELSSTWTHELCSFRVGEISQYDAESSRIKLLPVPGYPNASEKKIDQEVTVFRDLSNPSPCIVQHPVKQIDYSSLIDVHLVKHGNLNTTKAIADSSNENFAQDQDVLTRQSNVNVWDEISEGLSAKKAELSKEDGWSQSDISGRSTWSYRPLRCSALGPSMALKAQNGI